MDLSLPSLSGLRAFEATARHASVTLAAGELNVTPGAISLQLKELEAALGVQLFVRRPRNISLSPHGEEYFAVIRTAFRLMREGTSDLIARSGRTSITISCTPTFAMQWLMPRLARFEAEFPEIDVRVSASNRTSDFTRDRIDLAVRHGFGRYDGLTSERLIDDELTPVCTPNLATQANAGVSPPNLADIPLLHDEHRHDWMLWLQAAGLSHVDAARGTVFTDSNGAIEAAKAGHGIALVRLSLVEKELSEGTLVAPFPKAIASDLAYHLVYPSSALDRQGVTACRDWLLSEASHGKHFGNNEEQRPSARSV